MKQLTFLLGFSIAALACGQFKPTPPAEIAAFEPFLGEWSGELSLGPGGGQQLKGVAQFKFEKVLDGLYVQLSLTQDIPSMGVVRGHTIFAWDPKEKKLRSHSFANGGMADPSRPRQETGTLASGSLVMSSVEFKPAYVQSLLIQSDGTMKYFFQMDVSGNGNLVEVGRGTLKRKT